MTDIDYDQVVFLDTETTGLEAARHPIWDLAYIRDGLEKQWFFEVDLSTADSRALEIGHYWERVGSKDTVDYADPREVCREVALDLRGRHIVGMVPSFDDLRLGNLLRDNGFPETWHYHLIDAETLVAGKLGMQPPYTSKEVSEAIGVEPPSDEERHTALGDARWAKRLYEAVYQN